jgi:uncharacterized protein YcfL
MKTNLLNSLTGACLLAGAIAICGCKTTMNTVEPAETSGKRNMLPDKRVLTDAGLAKKVYVVGINEDMTVGGLLKAQVEVWNRTRSQARFNYSWEWFDSAGMLVSPTSTAVNQCVIAGQETRFLSAVAPTPRCRDFRVKFIEKTR